LKREAYRTPTPDEIASSKLIPYCAARNPRYEIATHNQVIAEYLEAVERQEITRLLISMPPRHGKTLLLQMFMEWYTGRHPEEEVIYSTYSGDRAQDVGLGVKHGITSDEFKYVFPGILPSGTSVSKSKISIKGGGNLFFVGTNEGITGRGANCILGGTLINTSQGLKKIEDLIDTFSYCNEDILLLSLDEGTGKLEYKKMIAARCSSNEEIYSIRTGTGRSVKVTGGHRFYILGKGLVKARNLQRNDTIFFVCGIP